MTDDTGRSPYGSMEDLPSVIEARRMLLGLKMISWVHGRKVRRQIKELTNNLTEMTGAVDGFYSALGDRGWIFHDDLNLEAMRELAGSPDAESAEQGLIDYYRADDHIQWSLRRLGHHAAMRPRLDLAQRALHDYQENRYYSCVLVLLAVMDGFVNDFQPAVRKGLHARDSEQMSPWDKAAGHHQGLAHVHRTYNERVSKLDATEQVALRRNGLIHGMLPNFNNVTIATKAWNLLFAVSDWADGEVERQKPKEDELSLRDVLREHADFQTVKKKSDEFVPYSVTDTDEMSELREHSMILEFLGEWSKRQWGLLGGHFIRFGDQERDVGGQAKEARELYQESPLDLWEVTAVRRQTSSLAFIDVKLRINGIDRDATVRLLLCTESNDIELDPDSGGWRVAPYYPESFWTPDAEG